MAQTLRSFLELREAELAEQIRTLQAEMEEVKLARAAIEARSGIPQRPPMSFDQMSKMTHRDMIVAALDRRPDGGTSDKVLAWVAEDFGAEIAAASISSQLSRLKTSGEVTLDPATKIWRSLKRVREQNLHSMLYDGPNENEAGATASEANAEGAARAPGVHNPQSSPDQAQD